MTPRPTAPGRRRRTPAALLGAIALSLLAPTTLAPAATAAEPETITEGSLTWGIKESFRGYLGEDSFWAEDGATVSEDGIFDFPLVSGTFDAASETTDLQFAGSASFDAYGGILRIRLSDPRVEITPRGATLYLDSEDSNGDVQEDSPFVTLDFASGVYTYDDDANTSHWSAIPSAFTRAGAAVFGGYYNTGTATDPVSFTYTGPGAMPVEQNEEWTAPGTPVYAETARNLATGRTATWRPVSVSADGERLYVLTSTRYLPEGASSEVVEPRLVALDPDSLEQLAVSDALGDNNFGTAVYDAARDAVYLQHVGSAQLFAVQWDASTEALVSEVVEPAGTLRLDNLFLAEAEGPGIFYGTHSQYGPEGQAYTVVRYERDETGTWGKTVHDLSSLAHPLESIVGDGVTVSLTEQPYGLWVTPDGTVMLAHGLGRFELVMSPFSYSGQAFPEPILIVDPVTLETTEIPGTAYREQPFAIVGSAGWTSFASDGTDRFYLQSNEGTRQLLALRKVDGAWQLDHRAEHSSTATFSATRGVIDQTTGLALAGRFALDLETGAQTTLFGSTTNLAVYGEDSVIYTSEVIGAGATQERGVIRHELVAQSPAILTQPEAAQAEIGVGETSATASFSVAARGIPAPAVRWQTREPGATSIWAWQDVPGATDTELEVTATLHDDGREYRAVVGNAGGELASEAVTLTVLAAPTIVTDLRDVTVTEGADAQLVIAASATPEAAITWQRRVAGFWQDVTADDDGLVIGPVSLTVPATATDQSGTLFRAKVSNSVGTVVSRAARLTVNARATVPEGGLHLDGAALEWSGSAEMQAAPPFGGSNYFSAGVSDGSQATYAQAAGSVEVLHVAGDGTRTPATWATRAAQVSGDVTQGVRLSDGEAWLSDDGSARVEWTGAWSVNFYGGIAPFTVTDPVLTVDTAGRGTLTATLSGYASSMANPEVREPISPVADVVVATFADVELDPAGAVTVAPEYAGVAVTVPSSLAPQFTATAGWGSWPQSFVDFHVLSGLATYWYTSGGAADHLKAPSDISFDLTGARILDAPGPVAPVIVTQPASATRLVGEAATLSVAAEGEGLSYRWHKRIGSLWLDVTGETGASLRLPHVTVEDSGQYRVQVTNAAGSVTSSPAVLSVAKRATTLTVTAPATRAFGKAATVTVRAPGRTGAVTLAWGTSSRTARLTGGKATFTLPARLAVAKHRLTASLAASDTHAAASASTTLKVTRATVKVSKVKVTKKPTRTRQGTARVTARSRTGTTVSGKVTVTLKRAGVTRKVTAKVKNGTATVTLPRLAKGTWRLKATFATTASFSKAAGKTTKVKVTR